MVYIAKGRRKWLPAQRHSQSKKNHKKHYTGEALPVTEQSIMLRWIAFLFLGDFCSAKWGLCGLNFQWDTLCPSCRCFLHPFYWVQLLATLWTRALHAACQAQFLSVWGCSSCIIHRLTIVQIKWDDQLPISSNWKQVTLPQLAATSRWKGQGGIRGERQAGVKHQQGASVVVDEAKEKI